MSRVRVAKRVVETRGLAWTRERERERERREAGKETCFRGFNVHGFFDPTLREEGAFQAIKIIY